MTTRTLIPETKAEALVRRPVLPAPTTGSLGLFRGWGPSI